jgi:cytoskeletal protein RodZ
VVKKIALTVAESLKSQPLALALVVVNVMFIVVLVWVFHGVSQANQRRDEQRDQLIQELQKACAPSAPVEQKKR